MSNRVLLGQSAIEYLMTYGWMLLVVAIVGGAIFATVGDQVTDSTSGFSGSDVLIDDFGVTSDDELGLGARNGAGNGLVISKVNVSDPDAGEWIFKEFTSDSRVSVGDEKVFQIPNVTRGDGSNSLNVEITYDSGGLSNLSVSGTVSGDLELTGSGLEYEGSPEDSTESGGGGGGGSEPPQDSIQQFYTNFSEYPNGTSLPDEEDWNSTNMTVVSEEYVENQDPRFDSVDFSGGKAVLHGDSGILFSNTSSTSLEIYASLIVPETTQSFLSLQGSEQGYTYYNLNNTLTGESKVEVVNQSGDSEAVANTTDLGGIWPSNESVGVRASLSSDYYRMRWGFTGEDESQWSENGEWVFEDEPNNVSGNIAGGLSGTGLYIDEYALGLEGESAPTGPVE